MKSKQRSYTIAALIPRYFMDSSPPLLKRDGTCGKGHHNCLDTGHGDQCCDNNSYCYVNAAQEPRCCPLGSNCVSDSKCNSKAYYCIRTITPTTTNAATSNASLPTEAGCCGRSCPMPGYYLCPKDLGGNCCPYNSECQAGGNCVAVFTPSSSTEPLITPAVEGCTTSQYKCPDGTGCCNNWQSCTRMDNTAYCADGIPTGSDAPEVNDGSSKGLSDGAKAGVSVTVVASVGLVAGVAAWVWILLKRKWARAIRSSPVNACQDESAAKEQDGQAEPATIQEQDGDYFGRLTRPRNQTNHSPGPERAVPRHPETPSDITTPVEIDSAVLPPEQGDFGLPSVAELPETPVELDGSPLAPESHEHTYFWSSDDSQSE